MDKAKRVVFVVTDILGNMTFVEADSWQIHGNTILELYNKETSISAGIFVLANVISWKVE